MQQGNALRAVAIDDNSEFLDALEQMLNNTGAVELAAKAGTVESGIIAIEDHQPQVVFLDVELPDGSGFDILKALQTIEFEIIFTTAYEHYALQAIKFSAIDYLLKPFGQEELKEAIGKLNTNKYLNSTPIEALQNNLLQQNPQQKKLGLHTLEGVYFIELKDIIRCKAEGNYTEFYIAEKGTMVISTPIKKFTELLEDFGFYRVHNSHLVNLNHVVQYARADGGKVVMTDGANVDLSRKRKNEFLALLGQL